MGSEAIYAYLLRGSRPARERRWYALLYERMLRGRLEVLHEIPWRRDRQWRGMVHHTRGEIRRAQKIWVRADNELRRAGAAPAPRRRPCGGGPARCTCRACLCDWCTRPYLPVHSGAFLEYG